MDGTILITGATGYVGGRLLADFERRGTAVRALARHPEALRGRVAPTTEVVRGDVLDAASLAGAMAGVHTAYYLVHSMGAAADFAGLDREAARVFGAAARDAGVRRIVYLGGLGDGADELSAHLRSRHETGDVLRESGVEVVEFRASIVIGSGSLSFEMVRALTERLPVMVCPRWVAIQAQPIAVEDVLAYLVAALDLHAGPSRIFEIGGPDVVSYGDIMREYARQRGLRRLMIPVPFLTPHLSSLWLALVTPLYARVGRKLIRSIRNATVVRDPQALQVFAVRPRGLRDAIARAIDAHDGHPGAGRWSDSRSASLPPAPASGPGPSAAVLTDRRETVVDAPAAAAFAPIRRIGGDRGWYCGTMLWRMRGWLDLLVGGVGMRRGRRDPESCVPGDPLDFWRVAAYEPDHLLRLQAEMKVPGRAWLEFTVEPVTDRQSRIRQVARFEPSGLLGRLYWYALLPVHAVIFSGMLRAIGRRAVRHPSHPPGQMPPDAPHVHDSTSRHATAPPCRTGSRRSPSTSRVLQGAVPTMRKLFASALVFTLVAAGTASLRASEPPTKDIVDTAVAAGNFTTLAKALTAAGLVETLKGKGPFTVFAPTDEAFAKLPAGTLDALLKDKAKLTAVLTYHVVAGTVMAADVIKLKDAKTVQGQSITIDTSKGVKVDNANVVKTDIVCTNGVIHVIDSVLLPK